MYLTRPKFSISATFVTASIKAGACLFHVANNPGLFSCSHRREDAVSTASEVLSKGVPCLLWKKGIQRAPVGQSKLRSVRLRNYSVFIEILSTTTSKMGV